MKKCMIVAVGRNMEIGVRGGLPWHISEDLKYFKQQTSGCPVIMGRTTYYSLPKRPLSGRVNIVLNLGGDPIPEVTAVLSLAEAYAEAERTGCEKCFVMGGASVYRAALGDMDELYITRVHAEVEEADVFFPEIDSAVWVEESVSDVRKDASNGLEYEFVKYVRR